MSTRCQIVIESTDRPTIYRHSDGMPECMQNVLPPFLAEFARARGWDPEYLTAQLVHRLIQESPAGRFLGFGITTGLQCDVAYVYVVRPDFSVEVRRPTAKFTGAPTLANTKRVTLLKVL